MRKFLKIVTVTGADDSVRADELIAIAKEYPFVEFGILLSRSYFPNGRSRFPSGAWKSENLWRLSQAGVRLSGHLCGKYVRDVLHGDWSVIRMEPTHWHYFERFQINTHGEQFSASNLRWPLYPGGREIIFQLDEVNDNFLPTAQELGYRATGLFDLSHGAGVLPQEWPSACSLWIGYAGGLGPANVAEQLDRIEKVAGKEAWIDAETKVRSDNGLRFDVDKAAAFLEEAKPWVIEGFNRSLKTYPNLSEYAQ